MDTAALKPPVPSLYIAALGVEAVTLTMPIVHALRNEGIRVETDYSGASLKSQMKKADKYGAAFTLIVGEQEMQSGTAVLRDMGTKDQVAVSLKNIVEELKTKLSTSR
jgi:histidyl-tRNA synthetase